jgi:hypothetical protein
MACSFQCLNLPMPSPKGLITFDVLNISGSMLKNLISQDSGASSKGYQLEISWFFVNSIVQYS